MLSLSLGRRKQWNKDAMKLLTVLYSVFQTHTSHTLFYACMCTRVCMCVRVYAFAPLQQPVSHHDITPCTSSTHTLPLAPQLLTYLTTHHISQQEHRHTPHVTSSSSDQCSQGAPVTRAMAVPEYLSHRQVTIESPESRQGLGPHPHVSLRWRDGEGALTFPQIRL